VNPLTLPILAFCLGPGGFDLTPPRLRYHVRKTLKLLGRKAIVFGFMVCLDAMTAACGSRRTPAELPVPPQATPTPESHTPSAVTPQPPQTAPPPPVVASPGPRITDASCAVIAEPGEPVATVAISDRVDPSNAPHPTNNGERLLFRQIYETLVRADCSGRVVPGLAASWRLDPDGRTWTITLRENARFSDGTPVTATDVRASWTADGAGSELRPQARRLVQSVAAVDERTLAVTLRSGRIDAPLPLAHTDLAIARRVVGSRWPLGTRSDRAMPNHDAPSGAAKATFTLSRDNAPPLRFLVAPGDPRDVLDKGADLLLTRDPAVLDYAATLPSFQSSPLEWQRTHVLLVPGRRRSAVPLAEDARNALAVDAVRGEARGALGPFWWETLQGCEAGPSQTRDPSASATRIVYDAADGAARDLSERLVGLARASGSAATAILDVLLADRPRRTFARAAALTGEQLGRARRRGTDAGYTMSLERRPLDPCREMQVMLDSAPWLDPEAIVPLVETRLRAVVRRGRSGLTAEWDGALLIDGGGGARSR
jgi:hypothetical protein